MTWLSNFMLSFVWYVTNQPCPSLNSNLVKSPIQLEHGWVTTSRSLFGCHHLSISKDSKMGSANLCD